MNSPALVPPSVRAVVTVSLGRFGAHRAELHTFTGLPDDGEHIALRFPAPPGSRDAPLVRVHSECLTGDVFGSARCDCGPQLEEAVERLAESGGVLLYLRQEGRGIGLYNKIDAYVLQDQGCDTYEANRLLGKAPDARNYRVAAAMLGVLGVSRIRLLTNNPEKVRQLRRYGVEVAEVVSTGVYLTDDNVRYLRAKVQRAQHSLALDPGV